MVVGSAVASVGLLALGLVGGILKDLKGFRIFDCTQIHNQNISLERTRRWDVLWPLH